MSSLQAMKNHLVDKMNPNLDFVDGRFALISLAFQDRLLQQTSVIILINKSVNKGGEM